MAEQSQAWQDDERLAGRLYDMVLAAQPDSEGWQRYLRNYARREDMVMAFPRIMELVDAPNGRRQAQQYLFDCYKDGMERIIRMSAQAWRDAPDLSDAERRRADALRDMLAWFDAGAILPPRTSRPA